MVTIIKKAVKKTARNDPNTSKKNRKLIRNGAITVIPSPYPSHVAIPPNPVAVAPAGAKKDDQYLTRFAMLGKN